MKLAQSILRVALVAAGLIGGFAEADTNVVQGSIVTLNGTFGTGGWGSAALAAASSLSDGVLLAETQTWNQGSVWWDASQAASANNTITLGLGGRFQLDRFIVQADDNDTYRLEYQGDDQRWHTAWDIPSVASYGLVSRDSGSLSSPLFATALRFSATSGDGDYAVSEIQGFGVAAPVPEPKTYVLSLAGLGVIIAMIWRSGTRP